MPLDKECKHCGKSFVVVDTTRLFCSVSCARRFHNKERSSTPILVFFWNRVRLGSVPEHCPEIGECWIWTGGIRGDPGYGVITRTGEKAHRFSYSVHVGEIPEGLYVCHKCDCRICVRPDHLFVGTQTDNMRDMKSKGRDNYIGRKPGTWTLSSKLTPANVLEIRELLSSGMKHSDIAEIYGVERAHISSISSKRRWGWL